MTTRSITLGLTTCLVALLAMSRVSSAPSDASLSIAAVVSSGHRTVARSVPTQLIGSTLRSGAVALPLTHNLPHGHYTITMRLLEVSGTGPVQGSALATRASRTEV